MAGAVVVGVAATNPRSMLLCLVVVWSSDRAIYLLLLLFWYFCVAEVPSVWCKNHFPTMCVLQGQLSSQPLTWCGIFLEQLQCLHHRIYLFMHIISYRTCLVCRFSISHFPFHLCLVPRPHSPARPNEIKGKHQAHFFVASFLPAGLCPNCVSITPGSVVGRVSVVLRIQQVRILVIPSCSRPCQM